VLAQKIAEASDVLLHPDVGDVAPVLGKDLGLRHYGNYATLVGIAEKELAGLDGRPGAGRGHDAGALDHRLRQAVPISEMLVSIFERRDRLEVEGGQHLDAALFHESLVLSSATLALRHVAREQDDDGVKTGIGEPADPTFGAIGVRRPQNRR